MPICDNHKSSLTRRGFLKGVPVAGCALAAPVVTFAPVVVVMLSRVKT